MSRRFLFAGEASGDLLGAPLVRPGDVGVGGAAMQQAGLTPLFPFEAFQVMGFTSVLPALPRILYLLQRIKRWILKNRPSTVVLIDYAEFNLLLARQLRRGGYGGQIIQYVCPSIWAWRKKRQKTLEENVDHLLALLPFEKELLDMPVTVVQHPLFHKIETHAYSKQFPGIALFPGSRRQEIEENLPLQLAAARPLGPLFISVAHPKLERRIRELAPEATLVASEERYDLMRTAQGALATCGTVILELGLHQTPTVVTYKLSPLHYFLAREIFKIRLPYYSLVNLIANRELFPEFIHKKVSPEEVQKTLERVMAKRPTFSWSSGAPKAEEVLSALSLP